MENDGVLVKILGTGDRWNRVQIPALPCNLGRLLKVCLLISAFFKMGIRAPSRSSFEQLT